MLTLTGAQTAQGTAQVSDNTTERLSQKAYQAIRGALKSGELRPGQRLILRPLASKLGLSATPVREALLRLVSEQALGLDERNSVLVPMLGTDELEELQELRCDLEGRAAAVVAERATAQQIAALEQLHAELRAAVESGDREVAIDRNEAFHHYILKASGRPTLVRMVDALQVRLGPLEALSASGRSELPEDNPHQRLIDALRARDPAEARAAIVESIVESFRALRRTVAPGRAFSNA